MMTEAGSTRETRQGVVHRDTPGNVLRMCQFSGRVVFMRSGDKQEVKKSALQNKLQILTYYMEQNPS
jgi:hypothetical protein